MESIIVVLRCLVAAIFLTVGIFVLTAIRCGRQCTHYGVGLGGRYVNTHRIYARQAFYFALAAAVITVALVRFEGRDMGNSLLATHIFILIPFLVILAYGAESTGLRDTSTYEYFAYACVLLYLGTAMTGLVLLFPEFAEGVLSAVKFVVYLIVFVLRIIRQAIFGL